MLLGAGEVDEVRAGLAGRHDHQVDLRAAQEPDGGLVAALVHDVVDDAEAREPRRSGSPRRRSRRAGRGRRSISLRRRNEPAGSSAADARRAGRGPRSMSSTQLLGLVEQHPARVRRRAGRCPRARAPRSWPTCPRRPRRRPPSAAGAQVVDRVDAELLVELADGLGPEARDAQQVDQARRDLGLEPLVVGEAAGRGELGDLVADRGADARDPRRRAGAVGRARGRPGCARWRRRRGGRRRS